MEKGLKTLVLLDAHAIIHRAYHALPDFLSSSGEPTGALYGLSNMLMKIIADLKPDYIAACYDLPQKTFRHEVYEGYKAGRAKAEEALVLQIKSSRKIFEAFNIPIYDAPGFEADDILGTIVEKMKKNGLKIIIASGDMDTMQLVDGEEVQVYTLKKGITDTILYDERKVEERFGFAPKFLPDYKGLRGDPSDNIIGVRGIGEKTATNLIAKFGTIEEIYKELRERKEIFKKLGLTDRIIKILEDNEEEALFSKTLAKIRYDAPINFKLPEKTFWQNADLEKIENVFTEFEFRSLFARLKNFFDNKVSLSENYVLRHSHSAPEGQDLSGHSEDSSGHSSLPEYLQETSIALWLLNSDLTDPKMEDILRFAKAKDFETAKKYIFNELKEKKLDKVFEEIEKPIIPLVKEVQEHGILIDKAYFKKLSAEYHKELDKITAQIYKLSGTEFNINSSKQLGEVLFEKMNIRSTSGKRQRKTKNGTFSTRVSVLEELEDGNPVIHEILVYREYQKLLSTYIDAIPEKAGKDGRLHAKFLQNGTTTGRFSSQNPNLQNLPIKSELGKKIRAGFVAPKRSKLLTLDYSQIELRVVAMLSGDKKMIQIFSESKDIHAGVASFVFGVPIEKVDREMRRQAKVINFGIIYGMGVTALRKNLGGTREEAQKFYDNYFKQFSGVRDYMESVKIFAKERKYTETLFGRRRYFANINSRIQFLRNMAERTATNAPVQGTAADIIKLAIRYAEEDLKKEDLKDEAHLVLQIHDELVYEVKEEFLSKAERIIKNAMESVLDRSYLKYKTKIPLIAHSVSGDNLEEVK